MVKIVLKNGNVNAEILVMIAKRTYLACFNLPLCHHDKKFSFVDQTIQSKNIKHYES